MYDFNNVVDFDEYRLKKKLKSYTSGSMEHELIAAIIELYNTGTVEVYFDGDELMVKAVSGSGDIFKHMPGMEDPTDV